MTIVTEDVEGVAVVGLVEVAVMDALVDAAAIGPTARNFIFTVAVREILSGANSRRTIPRQVSSAVPRSSPAASRTIASWQS